ncbi:Glycosyl transferases group 1 [Pseudobutyrivibrio sp. OR37]|uniref:glycosyltransferase family 4 protein n=1 Tax=Pseudobutyrivibrio sp. OR37 TaxID=1798186 RepID=UPI0008E8BC4E|nr:glycosyltransferase family 4 protein [Pseudobutyrivibrio sp. OR37]SFI32008.1 Glycosyl transferases group 1 [Pseudobutyrivibrio sp. OR37]
MNILFISLLDFYSIEERGIYTDVLRKLREKNNYIYAISPVEKRNGGKTNIIEEPNCKILKLRIGNIQKTNIIEKGISTLTIEYQLVKAIKEYYSDIKFDLVLYPTPPITICGAVEYIKKRDNARTYLMLKDIFPQNTVDLGMLKKSGIKGLIYKYFRTKEKKLYGISDIIGCMSEANRKYILTHNPNLSTKMIEVFPNCIEILDKSVSNYDRVSIRRKYGIPIDKTVFVYGGNLGRPQCVSFIIECLKSQNLNSKAFFLVIGDGTDYHLLDEYIQEANPTNIKLMKRLPKQDYDAMVGACDVGLIFLDYRFTIPNFPSRLLSYMQAKIPVLAVTDINTDVGHIIEENSFGWWSPSNDSNAFAEKINAILAADINEWGENSFVALKKLYDVNKWVEVLVRGIS